MLCVAGRQLLGIRTMFELWKRHIGWRFARQSPVAAEEAPERPITTIIGPSDDGGGCARCGKPRARLLHCQQCRTQASLMTEYIDPDDTDPRPSHVAFNAEETGRTFQIAEWFAAYCRAQGEPIPADPMRALLGAAELMAQRLEYINAIKEREQWQADGGVAH